MSFQSWLQNLRSALAPRQTERQHPRRGSPRAATHRLNVEALEDRTVPSLYLTGYYPGTDVDTVPLLVTDVTSDGIADLIDTDDQFSAIVVHPGRGDGTLGDPIYNYLPTGRDLVAADFNGDGRLDLFTVIPGEVWSDNTAQVWAVYLGRGDGTFVFGQYPHEIDGWFAAERFRITDLNGDDRPDVLVGGVDYSQEYTAMLQNDGDWRSVPPHSIFINDVTVAEGNTGTASATFTLMLDAATTQTITVSYATADGTATAGSDYQTVSGTMTFAPGEISKTITVPVIGDRLAEPNETIVVNLSDAINATVADGQGIGTILDAEPRININNAAVNEGNTGTRPISFTVSLSAAYDLPVTLSYATANGTATAGSDYQAASGTLTIPAGQTSGTITVQVNGDRLAEPNETFFVNLSNLSYGVIVDGQGVGTIVDDEPRINISDVTKSEGKKNQTTLFTFTVTLSTAYDQPVTMSFQTVNGTATTSDNDFVAKTGTLTFAPGETTKTITIEVKGDSKKEANEYFYLNLFGNSTNSMFTKSRGTGTILNDD